MNDQCPGSETTIELPVTMEMLAPPTMATPTAVAPDDSDNDAEARANDQCPDVMTYRWNCMMSVCTTSEAMTQLRMFRNTVATMWFRMRSDQCPMMTLSNCP